MCSLFLKEGLILQSFLKRNETCYFDERKKIVPCKNLHIQGKTDVSLSFQRKGVQPNIKFWFDFYNYLLYVYCITCVQIRVLLENVIFL